MRIAVAVLACLLCGCASSGGLVRPAEDRQLLEVEQALFTAIARRDVRALELLVADDCVFRTAAGQASTGRREFLASVVALGDGLIGVRGEALEARAFAQSGVVSGLQRARVKQGSVVVEDVGQFIDVFERRGGRWMLVMALNAPQ